MAFVNERISQNERREFQISKYEKKTPFFWTIDREKNFILFEIITNRDKPTEIEFGFVWQDMILDVVFNKERFQPNIVKWTIESLDIPNEFKEHKDERMQELRNAMRVYGFSGFQFYKKGPVEVITNF